MAVLSSLPDEIPSGCIRDALVAMQSRNDISPAPYAPRFPLADDRCRGEMPPIAEVLAECDVGCHHWTVLE